MNETYYIELLTNVYKQEFPSEGTVTNVSLEAFYDFCSINKLIPSAVKLLSRWNTASETNSQLFAYWKAEATDLVFLEYRKLALVRKLTEAATTHNIPLVFFKGYLLAELYPDFTLRNSSDTDILVDESYLNDCIALLEELHYTPLSELDTDGVYTFHYEEDGISIHKIELHISLLEEMQESQYIYLNTIGFAAPENLMTTECCGLKLKTLHPGHHLLYQLLHMIKHIGCHGFPARYLLDTALFINTHLSEIDWLQLHKDIDALGYSLFCQHFFSILINYFEVPPSILCGMKILCSDVTNDLLQDILHFGARSYDEKLSHFFYYFEQTIERKEIKSECLLERVTFDGETVPYRIVPQEYQSNKTLQHRILMLRNLELI